MRCTHCRAEGATEIVIAKRGKGPVAEGSLCAECMVRAKGGHVMMKREFNALRKLGLSRACANHVMCMRVDQFFAVHALYGSSA